MYPTKEPQKKVVRYLVCGVFSGGAISGKLHPTPDEAQQEIENAEHSNLTFIPIYLPKGMKREKNANDIFLIGEPQEQPQEVETPQEQPQEVETPQEQPQEVETTQKQPQEVETTQKQPQE